MELTVHYVLFLQDQSDAQQNLEFVHVPFPDWKNAMGDKRG